MGIGPQLRAGHSSTGRHVKESAADQGRAVRPKDSVELHNLPLTISVRCKKRTDSEEMANEIRGYSKKEVAGAGVQAASNTPPWKRSA